MNDKIKLMTKLAIYDKNKRSEDDDINQFFQLDYVYIKNFWTRVSVTIGFLIIAAFYVLYVLFVKNTDIISIDYKAEALKIGVAYVYVIVFYTVVSGILANIEYMKAEIRIKKYFKLADELAAIDKPIDKSKKTIEPIDDLDEIPSDKASILRITRGVKRNGDTTGNPKINNRDR